MPIPNTTRDDESPPAAEAQPAPAAPQHQPAPRAGLHTTFVGLVIISALGSIIAFHYAQCFGDGSGSNASGLNITMDSGGTTPGGPIQSTDSVGSPRVIDAAPKNPGTPSTSPAGAAHPSEAIRIPGSTATDAAARNDDVIVVVLDSHAPGMPDGVPTLNGIAEAAAEDAVVTLRWVDGATIDATNSVQSEALVIALDASTPATAPITGHPLEVGLVRVKIVLSVSLVREGTRRSLLWHDEATMTRPTLDAAYTSALKELAPKLRDVLVDALSWKKRR